MFLKVKDDLTARGYGYPGWYREARPFDPEIAVVVWLNIQWEKDGYWIKYLIPWKGDFNNNV